MCCVCCHVSQALFCMCSFDCLLRSSFVHCFLCVLLRFCYSSVSRTVWYEFCWQFATFCLIVWHVSALRTVLNVCCKIVVRLFFCTPFWMWSLRLFGTLLPCALFWMCSVRFVVALVFCALFWMCCVRLFVKLVAHALFYMCFVWLYVTLVPCALFCMCSVWLFGTLVPRALFWMCFVIFFLR